MKRAILMIMSFLLAMPLMAQETMTRLMRPEALRALSQSGAPLLIIDVRPEQDYRTGHIPGAVNLPASHLFEPGTHLLPPMHKLRQLFNNAGLSRQLTVVVYDRGQNYMATRILWALDLLGHPDTRLLSGGIHQWQQANLPLEQKPIRKPKGDFLPTVDPEYLASKMTTRIAMTNPNMVLVDVRTADVYAGKRNPENNPRVGHIPSAINIPWRQNLLGEQEIGPIKPAKALATLYAKLPKNRLYILYCQYGSHSTLAYLLMREMGYRVTVYDGSWYEWSRDPSLPVYQGTEP